MARSTLSFGMLAAFASATAERRRGFEFGSPPPIRAATVISLMMRVKVLPRFASAAPFLCLMVLHLLWPDMPDAPLARVGKETGSKNATRLIFEGRDYNAGRFSGRWVAAHVIPSVRTIATPRRFA